MASDGFYPEGGRAMGGTNYLAAALLVDIEQPAPEVRVSEKFGVVMFALGEGGIAGHLEVQSSDPAALRRLGKAFYEAGAELAYQQSKAKPADPDETDVLELGERVAEALRGGAE
jgi:hypothetical protein